MTGCSRTLNYKIQGLLIIITIVYIVDNYIHVNMKEIHDDLTIH